MRAQAHSSPASIITAWLAQLGNWRWGLRGRVLEFAAYGSLDCWHAGAETARLAVRAEGGIYAAGHLHCESEGRRGQDDHRAQSRLRGWRWRGRRRCWSISIPQCNATSGLGHKPDERHALLDSRPLRESFRETYLPNLSLLPGARSFEDVDALANSSDSRSVMLAAHLAGSLGSFDLVLIDCPPSLGRPHAHGARQC